MQMAVDLQERRVAILACDGVEEIELTVPWQQLLDADAQVDLISLKPEIQGFNHLDRSHSYAVSRQVPECSVLEYDGLVLPGGVANPDFMRMDVGSVSLVREFLNAAKPVGAICHAPWMLIEADVVRGRTLTSYPSLRTDLVNAGATWVDEPVCIDRGLVTSRGPDDLQQFCEQVLKQLTSGRRDVVPTNSPTDTESAESFPASDPPANY